MENNTKVELSETILPEAVFSCLEGGTTSEVLEEMVNGLCAAKMLPKKCRKACIDALMDREKLGSTGIGRGVAVPHAKHPDVPKIIGAFGRSKKGIDFAAVDGLPVHLIFLLLSPKDGANEHLKVLSHIVKAARDELFCKFLVNAGGKKEIMELFKEVDSRTSTGG